MDISKNMFLKQKGHLGPNLLRSQIMNAKLLSKRKKNARAISENDLGNLEVACVKVVRTALLKWELYQWWRQMIQTLESVRLQEVFHRRNHEDWTSEIHKFHKTSVILSHDTRGLRGRECLPCKCATYRCKNNSFRFDKSHCKAKWLYLHMTRVRG